MLALGSAKSEALARSMLALMQQEAEQQERAAAAAQELQEEFYQLAAQRQQLSLQAGATAAAAADGPGQAATPSDQGGGGGQGSPGSTLAPGDAASLEQAAALWADLQAQLLQVQDLQACAQSVAGCSSHPRPIDGAALAQTDVGALVGGWAAEVHGIAQQLAQLSSGDSVSSHGTIQSAAVVEAAAEGGMVTTGQQQRQAQQPAACQALVLGTDPPGCPPGERHIDHLQMQLALHRSALASLRDAKAALERELEAAQAQAPLLRQQLQRRGLLSPATGAPAPPSAVRPAWTLDGGAGGAAAAAAATAVEALTKTVLRRRMERVMAPATDAAPALPAPAAAVQPPASLADAATEAVAPLSAAKPKRLFLDGAVAFASGDSVGSVDSVDVLPPQLLTGKKKKPVSAITGQLCDTAAVADQPAAAALLSMQQLVQRFQQAKAGAGQ